MACQLTGYLAAFQIESQSKSSIAIYGAQTEESGARVGWQIVADRRVLTKVAIKHFRNLNPIWVVLAVADVVGFYPTYVRENIQ